MTSQQSGECNDVRGAFDVASCYLQIALALNPLRLAAIRLLLRRRAYVCLTVACLTVGSAAAGVAFTFLDALLIRPPGGVASPDGLVNIEISDFPDFSDVSAASRNLIGVAASSPLAITLRRHSNTIEAQALMVTSSYFRTLGARPAAGQFWNEVDDHPGNPLEVVLTYATWQRLFGGDSSAVGAKVTVAGMPASVVGVAGKAFVGTGDEHVDLFLPLTSSEMLLGATTRLLTNRRAHWLSVIGRLRPGATLALASQDVARIVHDDEAVQRNHEGANKQLVSSLMADRRAHDVSNSLVVWLALLSAAAIIIACANVATLNFTSVIARREEFWIRRALGATARQLILHLVREAMNLALIATPIAILVVWWAVDGLAPVVTSIAPRSKVDWPLSTSSSLVTVAASVLMTLVCGTQGFAEVARSSTSQSRVVGTHATKSLIGSGLRRVLLAGQLAAVTSLAAWAATFAVGLHRASSQPWGIDVRRLVVIVPNNSIRGIAPNKKSTYSPLLTELATIPGVARFSVSSGAPFYSETFVPIVLHSQRDAGMERRLAVDFHAVDSSYFETVGQRLLVGRGFPDGPHAKSDVAIINHGLAKRMWPNESAIGECIRLLNEDAPCRTIVGVVDDATADRIGPRSAVPQVFVPVNQAPIPSDNVIIVRTRGAAAEAATRLRSALGPYGVTDVRAIGDLLEPQVAPLRIGTLSSWVVAGVGLVLTAVGLFGTVRYSIEQRAAELAIRSALGATNYELVRLVFGELGIVLAAGMMFGIVIAFIGHRLLLHWVMDLPAVSWSIVLLVSTVVLVAVLAATIQPTSRIGAIDPSTVLRG